MSDVVTSFGSRDDTLLILGALGIGAYFLLNRGKPAQQQTRAPRPLKAPTPSLPLPPPVQPQAGQTVGQTTAVVSPPPTVPSTVSASAAQARGVAAAAASAAAAAAAAQRAGAAAAAAAAAKKVTVAPPPLATKAGALTAATPKFTSTASAPAKVAPAPPPPKPTFTLVSSNPKAITALGLTR